MNWDDMLDAVEEYIAYNVVDSIEEYESNRDYLETTIEQEINNFLDNLDGYISVMHIREIVHDRLEEIG